MNNKKEKLLIAVDGSERSNETVRYVANFLPFRDMRVTLFNVFSAIPKYYQDLEKDPQFHGSAVNVRAWEAGQRKIINAFMEKAVEKLNNAGFSKTDIEVKVQNKKVGIARDIVAEARNNYRFVVSGRKGVSQISQMVLGGTASKLLEKVNFTTLVLHGNRQPPAGNILLAVDESTCAAQAVDLVGKTLSSHNIKISLVHVIRRSDEGQFGFQKYFMPDGGYTVALTETEAMLNKTKNRLIDLGFKDDDIDIKVLTGTSRAARIVMEADAGVYAAIVLGRRGISKVQEFFLGRVSNKVVQIARKHTVWVVGNQEY